MCRDRIAAYDSRLPACAKFSDACPTAQDAMPCARPTQLRLVPYEPDVRQGFLGAARHSNAEDDSRQQDAWSCPGEVQPRIAPGDPPVQRDPTSPSRSRRSGLPTVSGRRSASGPWPVGRHCAVGDAGSFWGASGPQAACRRRNAQAACSRPVERRAAAGSVVPYVATWPTFYWIARILTAVSAVFSNSMQSRPVRRLGFGCVLKQPAKRWKFGSGFFAARIDGRAVNPDP